MHNCGKTKISFIADVRTAAIKHCCTAISLQMCGPLNRTMAAGHDQSEIHKHKSMLSVKLYNRCDLVSQHCVRTGTNPTCEHGLNDREQFIFIAGYNTVIIKHLTL